MSALNGPWKWQRYNGYIIDSEGRTVLECHDKEIANAIAKVPEMITSIESTNASLKLIISGIKKQDPDTARLLDNIVWNQEKLLAEMEGRQ